MFNPNVLILTILSIGMACTPSTDSLGSQSTDTVTSMSSSDTSSLIDSLSLTNIKIGNSVNDHVPEFYFNLVDGTRVSSAGLEEKAESTYLFFFAAD